MTGPKIIRDTREDGGCAPVIRAATGIRRTNSGGWAAIHAGRLVGSFTGPGSRAAAIQAAGTNERVA